MQPNVQNPRQVNPDVSAPKPMGMAPGPSSQDLPTLVPSMPKPPKKKGPAIAITIAITVCILLIGAAIYVFVAAQNKTKPTPAPQDQQTTQTTPGRVSPDDIDTAKKNIDQDLNNINDSGDFQSDDLTNQTLGL